MENFNIGIGPAALIFFGVVGLIYLIAWWFGFFDPVRHPQFAAFKGERELFYYGRSDNPSTMWKRIRAEREHRFTIKELKAMGYSVRLVD